MDNKQQRGYARHQRGCLSLRSHAAVSELLHFSSDVTTRGNRKGYILFSIKIAHVCFMLQQGICTHARRKQPGADMLSAVS